MNICNKMCAVQNSQLCIESLTMCVLHMHRKLDTSDALRAPNTKSGSSTNPQVSASPHHATWKQPLKHAIHHRASSLWGPTHLTNDPSRCNSSGVNPPRSLEADATPTHPPHPCNIARSNYSLLHVHNSPPHSSLLGRRLHCKSVEQRVAHAVLSDIKNHIIL